MLVDETSELARATAPTPRVSVVIPCLNEAENIEACVGRAFRVLAENDLTGEVIVVDNGSDDGSGALARAAGATVVDEPRRGYGRAYQAGFAAARGDYIVMLDADLTYDFEEIPRFVRELDGGAELVMGNRMQGIRPGAMGLVSRLGNPLLSTFMNLLYKTPAGDVYCGMRGLRRDALSALELHATGMDFAPEMVIRAARKGVSIKEIPIELHPRGGTSKLAPFRDGWRGLRLMLVYHPTFVFFLPGMAMLLLGALLMLLVLAHVPLLGRDLYVHTLIGGGALAILGTQALCFGLCGRAYGVYQLGDSSRRLERMASTFRLEHGLFVGGLLALAGVAIEGVVVAKWIAHGLGSLGEERLAIVAAVLGIVGMQIVFTSFLLSIIGLRRRRV